MKELSVVALKENLPKLRLNRGQVGTIVMRLDEKHVEVEFADLKGRTYAQAAIAKSKLLELHHAPLAEAA